MDYQVWIYDESYVLYKKVVCGDLEAATREIYKAVKEGKEPILTTEIYYQLNINFEEVKREASQSKTEPDKGPRGKGDSKVRSRDEGATPEVGPGNGNSQPDNSAKD